MSLRIGIDIGSTTVKVVVLDEQNKLLFRSYERHYSKTRERACETLHSITGLLAGKQVKLVITGSAGLGVANASGIDFVQEVYATAAAVNTYIPKTDAVIELGGEDAKIIFFGGALEERMNGSCAGGTGAFIDQMATLMNVTVGELDALSLKHEKIYPIASRCGVFAKSDIQPILNQGGRKEDVAASIFQAVVDQTVAGTTPSVLPRPILRPTAGPPGWALTPAPPPPSWPSLQRTAACCTPITTPTRATRWPSCWSSCGPSTPCAETASRSVGRRSPATART